MSTTMTSSTPTSFEALPEECCLLILNNLPISDLLSAVPRVCRLWNTLAPEALRTRSSLSLFVWKNSQSEEEEDAAVMKLVNSCIRNHKLGATTRTSLIRMHAEALRLSSLSLVRAQRLVAYFPNIKRFELVRPDIPQVLTEDTDAGLHYLLEQWSSHLTSLALWSRYLFVPEYQTLLNRDTGDYDEWRNGLREFEEDIVTKISRLIDALTNLSTLRELIFYCLPQDRSWLELEIQFNLPPVFLDQLDRLEWMMPIGNDKSLYTQLAQHAAVSIQIRPAFQMVFGFWFQIRRFVHTLRQARFMDHISTLARRMRHLRLELWPVPEELDLLTEHFSHLHSLEVRTFMDVPLWHERISASLSRLSELRVLRLRLGYSYRDRPGRDVWSTTEVHHQIHPLHSVRVLLIGTWSCAIMPANWFVEQLKPALLLPALDTVYIENGDCLLEQCHPSMTAVESNPNYEMTCEAETVRRIHTALEPFDRCPALGVKRIRMSSHEYWQVRLPPLASGWQIVSHDTEYPWWQEGENEKKREVEIIG